MGIGKNSGSKCRELAKGSESVVVAVIDTGIDYNHPDLKGNIWINTGEVPAMVLMMTGMDMLMISTVGTLLIQTMTPWMEITTAHMLQGLLLLRQITAYRLRGFMAYQSRSFKIPRRWGGIHIRCD